MKMKTAIVFACVLAAAMAFGQHSGGLRPGVISKRAEDGKLNQLIEETLSKASAGITAADLGEAAANIGMAADSLINSDGGKVDIQATEDVINEVSASLDNTAAVSALFDDPLTYESNKMDAALTLLNGLMMKAQALEGAGESAEAALAAISMTANAMQTIVLDTVAIITYVSQNIDLGEHSEAKRWEFNGGYSRGPNGNSYSVGVSHSWRRRRSATKRWEFNGGYNHGPNGNSYSVGVSHSWRRRRSTTKRGWSGSVNAGHGPGGTSIGGSVSYSWRRR